MAAFVTMGEFSSYADAARSMVHDKDVFTPNAENHAVYMQMYEEVYRYIEKNNTKLFKRLRKFGKER